jgi:hypothetical protein
MLQEHLGANIFFGDGGMHDARGGLGAVQLDDELGKSGTLPILFFGTLTSSIVNFLIQ